MIKSAHYPFIIALILSIMVHVGFGVSGIIHPTPKVSEAQKPTIVMQQFTLEQTPPAINETLPPATTTVTPNPKNTPPKMDKASVPSAVKEKPVKKQKTKPIVTEKPVEKPQSEPTVTEKPIEEILIPENEEISTTNTEQQSQESPQDIVEEQITDKQATQSATTTDGIIRPKNTLSPSFPKSAKLKYEGPMGITGTMNYQRQGQNYTIRATFNIPFNKREFISEGMINGNNLIPLSYIDKRKGKVYASAIFDRENGVVLFGQGEEPTKTTDSIDFNHTPAYDLFSWAWQVAINGGKMPETWVTTGKKVYASPSITQQDIQETIYDTKENTPEHFLRLHSMLIERQDDKSKEYEFSFSPDFANVPAFIKMNTDGKTYAVHLIRVELDGKKQWEAVRQTGVRNQN